MGNKNVLIASVGLVLRTGTLFGGQSRQFTRQPVEVYSLPPVFTFVVLGDNRAGDLSTDSVYVKLLSMALERKPGFLVNVGDQIDKPGNREQWARFRELSKEVTVPYFLTVGNHDVHSTAPMSETLFREQVGLPGNEPYYSFVAGDALFVVLDSYLSGEEKKITGTQFAWLEGVLSNSKQKHKFIFIHHPLFPEAGQGMHAGNSLDRYPEERDRLHALFKTHQVALVFAGHEHLYLRRTVDGITYIVTGGGGGPLYTTDADGGFHHFVSVTVDSDAVKGEAVDISGRVRDRF